MASLTPIGAFPAGYECYSVTVKGGIVSTRWLVPGGANVYCHVALTGDQTGDTEDFWNRIVERVKHHVHGRFLKQKSFQGGVSLYPDMALSDRPPQQELQNVQAFFEGRRSDPTGSYELVAPAEAV